MRPNQQIMRPMSTRQQCCRSAFISATKAEGWQLSKGWASCLSQSLSAQKAMYRNLFTQSGSCVYDCLPMPLQVELSKGPWQLPDPRRCCLAEHHFPEHLQPNLQLQSFTILTPPMAGEASHLLKHLLLLKALSLLSLCRHPAEFYLISVFMSLSHYF